MRRRSVQRLAVVVTALAALACGIGVAFLWTDIVRIPAAWRELERLQALGDRYTDRWGVEDGEREWQAALDAAAIHLVRLQVPDFAGGERFELQRIPTDDGAGPFLLCYRSTKAERLPHPDAGGFLPERFEWHHRFLRGNGRLFVPESPFFLGHDRGYHWTDSGARTKPGVYWPHREGGISMGEDYPPRLYTWDRRGFVPHGFVDETPHAAPSPVGWSADPIHFDAERSREWLRSGLPGDILRGLEVRSKPREAAGESTDDVARPFCGHADADVRARALSLLSPGRDNVPPFEAALADPSPRVRLTALRRYCEWMCGSWRARVSRLAGDSDPAISGFALRVLATSFDVPTSCDAIHRLAVLGTAPTRMSDLEAVRNCSSPALAEAYRRLLATVAQDSEVAADSLALLLALEDEETDRFLFRPGSATREILLGEELPAESIYILRSRKSGIRFLADQYLPILENADAGNGRLVAAAMLHAWGEPGIIPVIAEMLSTLDLSELSGDSYWDLVEVLATNPDLAAVLVTRLLSRFEDYPYTLLDLLLLHPEPVAPDTTVPFLRRLLKDDSLDVDIGLIARFVLARWRIPPAKEELLAVLRLPDEMEAAVASIAHWPLLLEEEVVRDAALERLERARADFRDHEGHSLFRELVDTLASDFARTPIPGAVQVLERIADSGPSFAGTSFRAALRLTAWGTPGGRERLARLIEEGCWAYHLEPAERAEIPADLRARLAALE